MTGGLSSVGGPVDNRVHRLGKSGADEPARERALDRALDSLPVPPMPEGLAARIAATVPHLPQLSAGPEPEPVPAVLAPPVPRWRRYAVPVGLGGLAAVAASLAAVFLVSAQGWQAPGAAVSESAPPVVAAAGDAPAPEASPAVVPGAALPADVHLPARRTPAATPVLALGKAGDGAASAAATLAPAPAESAAAALAANALNPEAGEPPIPQLTPAEAAAIEHRAARRAAREDAPLPGAAGAVPALGLRAIPASAPAGPR